MMQFFKSVLDQDASPVVICDLQHTILYMNPTAVLRYADFGGEKLVGRNLMDCHNSRSKAKIENALRWFAEDIANNRLYTSYSEKENKDVYMVALRDEQGKLIGYYEKHEYRNREKGKFYETIY